jgi:hypothetical protein
MANALIRIIGDNEVNRKRRILPSTFMVIISRFIPARLVSSGVNHPGQFSARIIP